MSVKLSFVFAAVVGFGQLVFADPVSDVQDGQTLDAGQVQPTRVLAQPVASTAAVSDMLSGVLSSSGISSASPSPTVGPGGLPLYCSLLPVLPAECLKWCSMEEYGEGSPFKPVRLPLWLGADYYPESDPNFEPYSTYTRLNRAIGITQVLYTGSSGRRELRNVLAFSTAGLNGSIDDVWCMADVYGFARSSRYSAANQCNPANKVKQDGWFTSMQAFDQAVAEQSEIRAKDPGADPLFSLKSLCAPKQFENILFSSLTGLSISEKKGLAVGSKQTFRITVDREDQTQVNNHYSSFCMAHDQAINKTFLGVPTEYVANNGVFCGPLFGAKNFDAGNSGRLLVVQTLKEPYSGITPVQPLKNYLNIPPLIKVADPVDYVASATASGSVTSTVAADSSADADITLGAVGSAGSVSGVAPYVLMISLMTYTLSGH